MNVKHPSVVVVSGPNGAGKSTLALPLLVMLGVYGEFINADDIARKESPAQPESAAFTAGRIMLERIENAASRRVDFAFETTLASRSFAPRLKRLIRDGYEAHLLFLWLPNADMAVARVADRVRLGGHHVPEDVIRRRYDLGLSNFFRLFQPLVTTWRMFDSSGSRLRLIASGEQYDPGEKVVSVSEPQLWQTIVYAHDHE